MAGRRPAHRRARHGLRHLHQDLAKVSEAVRHVPTDRDGAVHRRDSEEHAHDHPRSATAPGLGLQRRVARACLAAVLTASRRCAHGAFADIAPGQVHTFYEAVGYMIQAQSDTQAQERLIAKFMELPNSAVRRHCPTQATTGSGPPACRAHARLVRGARASARMPASSGTSASGGWGRTPTVSRTLRA